MVKEPLNLCIPYFSFFKIHCLSDMHSLFEASDLAQRMEIGEFQVNEYEILEFNSAGVSSEKIKQRKFLCEASSFFYSQNFVWKLETQSGSLYYFPGGEYSLFSLSHDFC